MSVLLCFDIINTDTVVQLDLPSSWIQQVSLLPSRILEAEAIPLI